MMRGISYSVLRAIFALVIGLVLIMWPNTAINYLIITIGALFLVPGLISIIGYFVKKPSDQKIAFPLEGIGSVLFGLFLVIIPSFFADILTIILGLILMLGGVQQIASLTRARKWVTVPFLFFIVPTLIFIAGAMVIANPSGTRATALMIVGGTALLYGLFELVNWFKFERHKPESDIDTVYIDIDDK